MQDAVDETLVDGDVFRSVFRSVCLKPLMLLRAEPRTDPGPSEGAAELAMAVAHAVVEEKPMCEDYNSASGMIFPSPLPLASPDADDIKVETLDAYMVSDEVESTSPDLHEGVASTEVLDLVESLRNEHGLTVIATLHDLTLAARYGDRVTLLAEGRIVGDGSPASILTADTIAQYFGATVRIIDDPDGPVIVPALSQRSPND